MKVSGYLTISLKGLLLLEPNWTTLNCLGIRHMVHFRA